jgi:hypothetical protein
MYADLDFWLALVKNDDWLAGRAESLLDEHEGDLEVSLATYEGDPDVVYQASENIDEGLNTFDAFHAALSGGSIISSDRAYDELTGVNRIRLEPDENEDAAP